MKINRHRPFSIPAEELGNLHLVVLHTAIY